MEHPKVFISHASEDKDRFVLPFATALRERGIDAWVDKWEIKPGDSLTKKIFDEGLGKADAAIVILSRISVTKPWVREELDAAFVAKIQTNIRLIPVVIEECEIPMPLRHLAYVKIPNLTNLTQRVDEIARTLFDQSSKPVLGSAPKYVEPINLQLPGIEQSDARVLLEVGRICLTRECNSVNRRLLEQSVASLNITPALLVESLEILEGEYYVEGLHAIGQKFAIVKLTDRGAEETFQEIVPDYEMFEKKIALELINADQSDSRALSAKMAIPHIVVQHILDRLQSNGLIRVGKYIGGTRVFEVSARLKRALS